MVVGSLFYERAVRRQSTCHRPLSHDLVFLDRCQWAGLLHGRSRRRSSRFNNTFDRDDLARCVAGIARDRHALVEGAYAVGVVLHRDGALLTWFDGSGVALGNRATAATLALGNDQGLVARIGNNELAGTIGTLWDRTVVMRLLVDAELRTTRSHRGLRHSTQGEEAKAEREEELFHGIGLLFSLLVRRK